MACQSHFAVGRGKAGRLSIWRTCPPPGTGRGMGPAGDKFSRSEDAGNGGRGRSAAACNAANEVPPDAQSPRYRPAGHLRPVLAAAAMSAADKKDI